MITRTGKQIIRHAKSEARDGDCIWSMKNCYLSGVVVDVPHTRCTYIIKVSGVLAGAAYYPKWFGSWTLKVSM